MIDIVTNIAKHLNSYAPLLITFFLWRIAAHLKAIRKHLAGKLLYETAKDVINFENAIKRRKTEEEVDKNEIENTRGQRNT